MFRYLNLLLAFKLNNQHPMELVVVGTMATKTELANHNKAKQLVLALMDQVLDSLPNNNLVMLLLLSLPNFEARSCTSDKPMAASPKVFALVQTLEVIQATKTLVTQLWDK